MSRFLGIVLAVMLIFGFTAVTFAGEVTAKGDTKITLGGELRFRGEVRENVGDFRGNLDSLSDYSSYDTRVRLNLQADVSKNTRGFLQLETGGVTDSNSADGYMWGSANGATGLYTEGNAKRGDLRIREAWIQHKGSGLGIPATLKVGHIPVKIGYGLFLDHSKFGDDAIMVALNPTKELEVALATAKVTEGGSTQRGVESDLKVLLFSYKGAGFNVGGDVARFSDRNSIAGFPAANGLRLTNYGLRGDTKIGPVGLKAGVELQDGETKPVSAAEGAKTKFKGNAVLVGADYSLSGVTLNAEVARGSGDNQANDNKVKTFITSLGGDQHYTYVYENRTRTAGVIAPSSTDSALGASGTGLANTTYYKLGASAKPMKDLSADLGLYLLRATTAVSTDSRFKSKEIGTELDAKVTYQIDRNLVYFVEGGYLWAGKLFKNVIVGNVNPDEAYAVRHGITLSF